MNSFCIHCGGLITLKNSDKHGPGIDQCISDYEFLKHNGFVPATDKMDWSDYSARVRELMQ